MPRLLSPDDGCISVKVPTVRGARQYDGRTIEVTDPVHTRMLKQIGYVQADASGVPSRVSGFVCTRCGFKAFFNRCGRCGGDCEKE